MDMMVDIETLGRQTNSAILSIGACRFERHSEDMDSETFYRNVDLQSCLDVGMAIDGSTVYWWLNNSAAARQALCSPFPIRLGEALIDLNTFYQGADCVWSHGAIFDVVILEEAYRRAFIPSGRPPWHYRKARDTRTLFDPDVTPGYDDSKSSFREQDLGGTPHNARDDAIKQAKWVQRAFRLLKEVRRGA